MIWDWIWWNIGIYIWRRSSQQHSLKEVERRLGWMSLDYDMDYERTRRIKASREKE